MDRRRAAIVLFGLALAACPTTAARRPLVNPFPLRFPLSEAGTLEIAGHVVGQPRARDGIVVFATREGLLTAVVVPARRVLWSRSVEGASLDAGEAADPGSPALRVEGPVLRATDAGGRMLWEFTAEGPIAAAPALGHRSVFFGTAGRMFYALNAATGKVKWRRRLQGAPAHPAVVAAGRLAVAASNSVVYRLSRRGGSILSWQAVPSRVVYEPAAAGPFVLISSASPTVTALDMRSGTNAGQYEAPGPLVTGAVWSPPFVVLFVEDEASGRQKIVFLRSG